MSTIVRDTTDENDRLILKTLHAGTTSVDAKDGIDRCTVWVRTADVIAAVEAECGVRLVAESEPLADWEMELAYPGQKLVPADAIVIERGEIPEVTRNANGYLVCDHDESFIWSAGTTADQHRQSAMGSLACAEYIDAHPPVDFAQVAKISATIRAEDRSLGRHGDTTIVQYDSIALSLYRAGVRIEAK